jgi:hypothetical protein
MQSFEAVPATSHYTGRIHPALSSFFDEFCATLARLVAYVCTLALLFIVGVSLWVQLPQDGTVGPANRTGWTVAGRSTPAFATSQLDLAYRTRAYQILRHPDEGR